MTYPVVPIKLPSSLRGQENGRLPDRLLEEIPGGELHPVAAAAWRELVAAAKRDGIQLRPTSPVDTYRPIDVQVATFLARYDHVRRDTRHEIWRGQDWWLKPGVAGSAVPGTSNHGLGLAVDVADASGARLSWLLDHALRFGWSWESQSEPWHIRYVRGDSSDRPDVLAWPGPLRIGSRGEAVRIVQRKLGGLEVDGIYGPRTAIRVRRYRAKRPTLWPASGVVDLRTWTSLTRS